MKFSTIGGSIVLGLVVGTGTAQPDPGAGQCYRPAVLAWATSPIGNCTTYTRCPLAIACVLGGPAQLPPGGFILGASVCQTWTGGTPDGQGGCTGGVRVIGGNIPNPTPIPIQVCGAPNCSTGGGTE